MLNFFQAFQSSTLVENNFLNLPAGTYFLGSEALGSRVYLRQCYLELWEKILQTELTSQVLVTGTPGIGKKSFLYYALYRLMQDKQPVMVRFHDRNTYYVHDNEFKRVNTLTNDFEALLDPNTWILMDDSNMFELSKPFRIVLTCAPSRDIFESFILRKTLSLFMPVWAYGEIALVNHVIRTDMDRALVQERFKVWGGIPRYVFKSENVTSDLDLKQIDLALGKLNVVEAIQDIFSFPPDSFCHRILHIVPKADSFSLNFASPLIVQKLLNRLTKQKEWDVESPFWAEHPNLLDTIFVHFAKQALCKGGSYSLKNLQTEEVSTLSLTKREMLVYSNLSEVVQGEGFWIPLAIGGGGGSFDAIIPSLGFFRFCRGLDCPVEPNELVNWFRFQNSDSCRLYFLIPKESMASFKAQTVLSSGEAINIEQFAIGVDFKHEYNKCREKAFIREASPKPTVVPEKKPVVDPAKKPTTRRSVPMRLQKKPPATGKNSADSPATPNSTTSATPNNHTTSNAKPTINTRRVSLTPKEVSDSGKSPTALRPKSSRSSTELPASSVKPRTSTTARKGKNVTSPLMKPSEVLRPPSSTDVRTRNKSSTRQ